MVVRNTLLTLAKSRNFDRDAFFEKMEGISGLNERQWKDICGALLRQISRIVKGRNISIGKYIAQYEKILNDKDKKFNLTREQRNLYKKEIDKLKKEQVSNKIDVSVNDAKELLIMEGYKITKDGETGIDTNMMLNVLRDRFDRMRNEDRTKFIDIMWSFFPISDK